MTQNRFSHPVLKSRRWPRLASLLCRLMFSVLLLLSQTGRAANAAQKAPDPKDSSKKVCEWKSRDGVAFSWRGPKKYDAAKGVGLTFILHGSNLTHAWGFAN